MDTLLKALEARGFSVEITPPRQGRPDPYGRSTVIPSETYARLGDTAISFGLNEGAERQPKAPARRRGIFDTYAPPTEYVSISNGKLSLQIYSYHSRLRRRTWSDGKRQRVEDCLSSFLSEVIAIPESERLEQVAEERRQIERETLWREQEERERQRALEAACVEDLDARLADWNQARAIRELTDAIEQELRSQGEPRDSGSVTRQWLAWARARASELERRATRLPSADPEPGADADTEDRL